MSDADRQCGTCGWAERCSRPGMGMLWLCRRGAPLSANDGGRGQWPLVLGESDWCGEWEPRPEDGVDLSPCTVCGRGVPALTGAVPFAGGVAHKACMLPAGDDTPASTCRKCGAPVDPGTTLCPPKRGCVSTEAAAPAGIVTLRLHPDGHWIPNTPGKWLWTQPGRESAVEVEVFELHGGLMWRTADGESYRSVRRGAEGTWEWVTPGDDTQPTKPQEASDG